MHVTPAAAVCLALALSCLWLEGRGGAEVALPAGACSAQHSDAIEAALDRYFAATGAALRHQCFTRELSSLPIGLSEAELEAMAQAPPPGATLLRISDDPPGQGWFNLSIPPGYTPGHACGMVVALHGANLDGDSLVPLIDHQLGAAGLLVLYPTVAHAGEMWDAPNEAARVLQLVSWVGHRYRVDFRRLSILGVAMGGMGVWSYAAEHPGVWQAAAAAASRPTLAGASALARLRAVPFFVLHGQLDAGAQSSSPLELVAEAVATMRAQGMDAQLVAVPGVGHQLPAESWAPLLQWLVFAAPKPYSPRPWFLPPPGQRALGEIELDPLGLDSDDPALVLIRADQRAEARALLTQRISVDPSRLNYLYRALAWVPAMAETIPSGVTPRFFRAERGWGESNEHAALQDLQLAIKADASPGDAFIATAYLWAAKIHLKRFLLLTGQGGTDWVAPYDAFANCIKTSLRTDPRNQEAAELALQVMQLLPPSVRAGGTVTEAGQ